MLGILNLILDFNINSYIKILNNCFNQNIIVSNLYYAIKFISLYATSIIFCC